MTNEPMQRSGRELLGDDAPAEPEVHDELPVHLDLPIEVPEADALEQELDAPSDEDPR
jgi:hypothetical protein